MRNTQRSTVAVARERGVLRSVTLGKALLAFQPVDFVERFLRRRLKAYTPSTLTAPWDLRRELARIRSAGHALDAEEFAIGLKCVAAPLRDHTRRVVASLGMAGPAVRFADERVRRLAALVRDAAADASRALGGADVGRD